MMLDEIDISKVPLTPRGVNHDFNAVKQYSFVRFEKSVKWRTASLIGPVSDASDCDEEPRTEISIKDDISSLHQSPMIEFRKKRPKSLNGPLKFNPVNEDVIDTSLGWYKNYEKSKRKTIAVMRRLSTEPPVTSPRKSLPSSLSGSLKENIPPTDKETVEQIQDINTQHLDLLRVSVSESRPLLSNEYARLSASIVDWKHILGNEEDVPPEAQGRIQSTVGRTQILLNKRFNSTIDVLNKAENYADNEGVVVNDSDKKYMPDDVYAFVDLLINEIRNIDGEFNKLLQMRDNNWEEVQIDRPAVVVKKRPAVIAAQKVVAKSRIDLKSLRNRFRKADDVVDAVVDIRVFDQARRSKKRSQELRQSPVSLPQTPDVSLAVSEADSLNESGRSLRQSVRKTVRSNCVIKSTTGTPVHFDTPRPRRSARRSSVKPAAVAAAPLPNAAAMQFATEFLAPSAMLAADMAAGHKRAVPTDEDLMFLQPQPKKSRQSRF